MDMSTAMLQIPWLIPLIATAEIVGDVLFIIPRTRALAAIILTPLMSSFHMRYGIAILLVMAVILIWVIIEN